MHVYARIESISGQNTVVEIITTPTIDGREIPIEEMFHPSIVATLVDITNVDPRPDQWWTYEGEIGPDVTPGVFTPPSWLDQQ